MVTDRMRRAYQDHNKLVDVGACAIGLLLAPELTEFQAVQQAAAAGSRIDYYLAPQDADDHVDDADGTQMIRRRYADDADDADEDDRLRVKIPRKCCQLRRDPALCYTVIAALFFDEQLASQQLVRERLDGVA